MPPRPRPSCAQVNITWLTHLTSAVTVGLVGGVKIVPQWALALLVEQSLDVSPLNILGALLMIVAGTLFTYGRAQRTPRVRAQYAAGGGIGGQGHQFSFGGGSEKRARADCAGSRTSAQPSAPGSFKKAGPASELVSPHSSDSLKATQQATGTGLGRAQQRAQPAGQGTS